MASMIMEASNELRTATAAGRRCATSVLLHTIVPDHWLPITLIARNAAGQTWKTARAAFLAGTGTSHDTAHRVSGVAAGRRFRGTLWPHRRHGSSLALIAFWRLFGRLRVARSAGAGRARAQSSP